MTEWSTNYTWVECLRNEVLEWIRTVIYQILINNQFNEKEVFLAWVSNIKITVEGFKQS